MFDLLLDIKLKLRLFYRSFDVAVMVGAAVLTLLMHYVVSSGNPNTDAWIFCAIVSTIIVWGWKTFRTGVIGTLLIIGVLYFVVVALKSELHITGLLEKIFDIAVILAVAYPVYDLWVKPLLMIIIRIIERIVGYEDPIYEDTSWDEFEEGF